PNIAEACVADLAVAGVGAICLAYPVLYRHNEVRSLLARSGAAACLFVGRLRAFDYAAMMTDLRPDLPELQHLAVLGDPVDAVDPAAVVTLIGRERITQLLAVPTMLAMTLAAGTGDADLTSLRVVGSFGAAMSEDRVRATLDTFGARFVNGYGCSDGALCMTG